MRVVFFLNRRPLITLLVALTYFGGVVLLHEEISKVSVWFQQKLTLQGYNRLWTAVGLPLLVLTAAGVLPRVKDHRDSHIKAFYVLLSVLFMVVSYNTLLVVNVEVIHFPQYALLAIILFPLTVSATETVLLVGLLGLLDEAYQYLFLEPHWRYLDFNDMILNMIGGGAGVVFIYCLSDKRAFLGLKRRIPKRLIFIGTLLCILLLTVAWLSGCITEGPGGDGLLKLRRQVLPDTFWIDLQWGKSYHILTPWEGLFIGIVIIWIYGLIDTRLRSYE